LGFLHAPDQHEAPDLEVPGMSDVHPIAVLFECHSRSVQRLCRPSQVTRDDRYLGFRDNASRASHRLPGTERLDSTAKQRFRSNEISELRHCQATECKRRRVVAQGDSFQRAKGITHGERMRRSRDQ
jgi:hypothetical protein